MDEERKEDINEIIDRVDKDIELPPYNNEKKSLYSRRYQQYKREEKKERAKNKYERFCSWSAEQLSLSAGASTTKRLNNPLKLLGWQVTPGMVLSGAIMSGLLIFISWLFIFLINLVLGNIIPLSLMLIFLLVPFGASIFMFYRPKIEAKNKVISSSGEMILAILYMVVYMRSTPNLEGAVRFAALNLEGPISKDLKGVLWDLEVGKFNKIDKSLENYTEAWKDYNSDFIESISLLEAAMNETNPDRRDRMLQDAIDNILDGTKEKMKHYAQNLKTPVMIINALGAMLPILGMIMLPLISIFLGDAITPIHLVIIFNIMLPASLWIFMQRALSSRPPTVDSQSVNTENLPPRGKYHVDLFGIDKKVPTWPIGALVFFLVAFYGIAGYLLYPSFYPVQDPDLSRVPVIFQSGEGLASLPMLIRSLSLTLGAGLGIGISKYLGSIDRRNAEAEIEKMEDQFPNALFELGNKVSGGVPIEISLKKAADSSGDLEIAQLFEKSYNNIQKGMTFEEAVFNEKYGALKDFPSQMIETIMTAILKSSSKGTEMASTAMLTISRYLKNVHKTEERLNDLMEESTTTIMLLAYMLAPVISGVAVGMSQTIMNAMFSLSSQLETPDVEGAQGSGMGFGTVFENLDSAIPPEALQFVVGIYLIQLLYILGTFYMKIVHGENVTYKDLFIGKVMMIGMTTFTITVLIISQLFGGAVAQV